MENRPRRIKILFTIPNFDTAGSGKALLNVAKKLNPEKFEVEIACLHNRGFFFKEVETSGFKIHIFPFMHPMKPYFKGLKKCFNTSKKFKSINPDIVHSFHYGSDYSEALAVRLSGAKWLFTKKNMNWGSSSKRAWRIRSILSNAIIAQNTDMLEQFFKNSKKVTLIPRGVDTSYFKPVASDLTLYKKWNLSSKNKIIMCVANMARVKGIDVLLKAFKRVSQQDANYKLLLVGDCKNDFGNEMKSLTKKINLESAVVFCGKQSNVVSYLSLAQLVVLPTLSRGEGSPVSLLEAMACGKTVLGSNVSGIKDQLFNYPELLVETGNVEAWYEKIKEFLSKPNNELDSIGKTLRIHVCNNYSIEQEVQLCEGLYIKIHGKK